MEIVEQFKALTCNKLTKEENNFFCTKDADVSKFGPCFILEGRGHISGPSLKNKCLDFKEKA